jgi:glycosyltransferase involved in cell wall biosynthesis
MRRRYTVLHTESSVGWGGQEMRILLEAGALQERGHRVLIACAPDCRLAECARAAGLGVAGVAFRGALDWRAVRSVCRLLRDEQVDIVNTHSFIDGWVGAVAARLVNGVKVIRTRHLANPVSNRPLTRWLYTRLTDVLITTGEALRRRLIQENRLDPQKIFSIPTAVDLRRFDPVMHPRPGVRREIGIPAQAPLIGTIAMLRRMKGHDVFLDAAAIVRADIPEARFLIVGDIPSASPLKAELRERAARLGIQENVIFAGYRDDIPEVLADLDCVVLASTRSEGLPQVIVQALAMARPVVATDVGATSELIQHKVRGILVAPNDPSALAEGIVFVVREPELAAQWAQAGQECVRASYNLPHMADQVERVYQWLEAV